MALGLTLKSPRLHHVAEDAFVSAAEAMNQCLASGRKRMGLVFSEPDDSPSTGDRFLGAYLRQQLHLEPKNRIPHCEHRPAPELAEHFLTWLETHRLDAVLAAHAEPILRLFEEAGRKFPRDVKLVALVNDKLNHGFAGIHHAPAEFGALAVDMLVGMLHRGETGLPADAHYVLAPGRWVEGTRPETPAAATAPRRGKEKAGAAVSK